MFLFILSVIDAGIYVVGFIVCAVFVNAYVNNNAHEDAKRKKYKIEGGDQTDDTSDKVLDLIEAERFDEWATIVMSDGKVFFTSQKLRPIRQVAHRV
jgi:hypothetical protein